MRKFICFFAILNILAANTFVYAEAETEITEGVSSEGEQQSDEAFSVTAQTAVVIDPQTGIVLYDKNGDQEMYPASITKIMTALLAIEYAESEGHSFDEIITHSHNAVYNIGPGSSHIGMREGEQITLDQALYGILLASANEVCMAVAEHIDGTVDAFVERMNKRAAELGATHTHFANPHGFHDDNHYTSAHDIALIMAEAVKNEKFVNYISTYEFIIGTTNMVDEVRYLHNGNRLINPYSSFFWEGCIGGKTGFTDEAGNTLVIYGGDGEHKFIAAVMKEPGREYSYADAKALIEYAQTLYSGDKINILSKEKPIKDINIVQNGEIMGTASIVPTEDYEIELPQTMSADDIKLDIVAPESFDVPIGNGRNAGTVYAVFNDKVMCSIDLAVTDIKNADGEAVDFIEPEDGEKAVNKKGIFNILIIAGGVVAFLIVILIIFYIINGIIAKRRREKRLKLKALERRERRRANLEKKIGSVGDDND